MKAAHLLLATAALASASELTIYNQDFAVVRETIPLDLKAGANDARFSGATAQVEPDSVVLRERGDKTSWQILEQSYRNDPISEPLLLSQFEGQVIDFLRHEPQKPDEVVKAKIIRSGYVPGGEPVQPIVEFDGKLVFELPGRPLFPALNEGTILKPTLAWKLNAPEAGKFDAELTYVTGGLTWRASYNVVQRGKTDSVEILGWITMANTSGTGFTNARIKLMGGDVNKRPRPELGFEPPRVPQTFGGPGPVVAEKAFDEFHLYTLPNPIDLRDKETKQVEFLRANNVTAGRLYVYDGARLEQWTVGDRAGDNPDYGLQFNRKVAVYRTLRNSEANKLGVPLPKGTVRFYTRDDADGSLQFVGENEIDHTPKDERVRIYVGNSFDLTGERRRLEYKMASANQRAEESFEIKVRNHKDEPAELLVAEHLYRFTSWEIIAKSQDFEQKDAQSIEFRVGLKPGEEKIITYRVRYRW